MDAEAAKKIAAADEQKIIRAIEVCILVRKPLSEVHRTGRAPLKGWRALKIGLYPGRERLIERIHARTDQMIERNWLGEVRAWLDLREDSKPFDFIGYRELRAVLRGQMELDEAREAIQQSTRQYAKRQMTWFRKEVGVQWFAGFGDEPATQAQVMEWLASEGLSKESPPQK